jgi:ASC-1-like (ASCH) protein
MVSKKNRLRSKSRHKTQKNKPKSTPKSTPNNVITVKQPWFDFIKNGEKCVEGRIARGNFAKLIVGCNIFWKHNNSECPTRVIYIRKYKSFREMLQSEGIKRVLPNIDNIDEGVKIYRKYYTPSDEKAGVLALGVMPLDNKNPVIHEGKLQSPYYEYIRDGVKIYETRVYDDKRRKMRIGDSWNFRNNDNPDLPMIKTEILDVRVYKSFRDAIVETGVSQLLPQIENLEEAIGIYEGFDNGNYKTDGEKYGVVRFTISIKP